MRILRRKFKKINKLALIIFLVTFISFSITVIWLIKDIINLKGIKILTRLVFFGFVGGFLLFYFWKSLVSLIKHHYKSWGILTAFTILVTIGLGIGHHYFNFLYRQVSYLSEKQQITYTTYLINFKNQDFKSTSTIGIIANQTDIEGYILAQKIINQYKLKNKIIEYSSYNEMLNAFYRGKVAAIFVSANYQTLFSSEDAYKNISSETKIIYQYSEKRKNEDLKLASGKKLTEPFSALIMGVDSTGNKLNANAAFNGDTLILVTFNPQTLTASMLSLPRDTYVPIACRQNAYAKINSSAAYGTSCVIATVENLTNIKVDYYLKLNFKALVDLVDAVGGIQVDVEKPNYNYNSGVNCKGKVCEQNSKRQWGKHTVFIGVGPQKLNGEQALAYARCRHLYTESDLARNRHQQEIITALGHKILKIDSYETFENILNAVSSNIATNLSTEQILSGYKIIQTILLKSLNKDEPFTIKKTYLQVYSLPVNNGYMTLSALGYYPDSLSEIVEMMQINLGQKAKKPVTTFNYQINQDYHPKIYGKGITTGSKLTLLPSFTGHEVAEARQFATNHNLNFSVEGNTDLIISQKPAPGTLLNKVQNLKVTTELTEEPVEKPTEELMDIEVD